MGVAIIDKAQGGKETLVFSECFQTTTKISHDKRLGLIGSELEKVIKEYEPRALAIENLFFKSNAKTAMHVAEARGVMLYEAAKNGLEVKEFTPMEIKVAVTGYGKSEKAQVTDMVKRLIKIDKLIKYDDEFDAIAVGLTYFAIVRNK